MKDPQRVIPGIKPPPCGHRISFECHHGLLNKCPDRGGEVFVFMINNIEISLHPGIGKGVGHEAFHLDLF